MNGNSPIRPDESIGKLKAITAELSAILRPPIRRPVSETARKHVPIRKGGAKWTPVKTPYMLEPMNELRSRKRKAVVFVGPARSGKTLALLDCWLAHVMLCEPGDMGLFFPAQRLAHDFRKRRIERMFQRSHELRAEFTARARDSGIYLMQFKSGMMVNLAWPTSSQVAQRDLIYAALTDYDSMPNSIGTEGSPFDLAGTRVQNAHSRGMIMIESSPKRLIIDSDEEPSGPHEAPATEGGIFPIYNRGTRCRWHWPCLKCGHLFEAPALPDYEKAEPGDAHIMCLECGHRHAISDRDEMNMRGRWVAEPGREDSPIASYWLKGSAAGYKSWEDLAFSQINADAEFERTGDETALITAANVQQGIPYASRRRSTLKIAMMKERLEADLLQKVIPEPVKLIYAAVDVQKRSFEVAVFGYGEGRERWLIDRYSIKKTENGDDILPASYIEHWSVLTKQVLLKPYDLTDGRSVLPHHTAIDSGGYTERGGLVQVAARSHAWWRSLGANRARAMLVRGGGSQTINTVKRTFPKSGHGSHGDVPVLVMNVGEIKNWLHSDMQRDIPGPGYIHLPGWISKKHMNEFLAERHTGGRYGKTQGRNESLDLLVYCDAMHVFDGVDRIDWGDPPAWADIGNPDNPNIITRAHRIEAARHPALGIRRQNWINSWR